MISLQPITPNNWIECIELAPTPEQQAHGYVAPNVLSLAQAYAEPWWIPLAIYAGTTMIGFVLYGRWPQSGYASYWGNKPRPGIDYILRMMIDGRYQGQGYGKASFAVLLERITAQPGCQAVELDYDRANIVAARLYAGYGFQPIEENKDGEILARFIVGGR